jgi:hypothetical protein
MSKHEKAALSTAVQTVHATPLRSGKLESTRFERFKAFFLPRLRKQEELGVAFEEATVRRIEAEGDRFVEEAAKIAAERDLLRQQELRAFCETIDSVFKSDDSQLVSSLKMAKLLETNPELAAQLEKVNAVLDRLNAQKSCRIEFRQHPDDA